MKKIIMKPQKLSLYADMKIQARLFYAQFKKNACSFRTLKLALPVLVLGVFAIGVFQFAGIQNTSLVPGEVQKLSQSSTLSELKKIRGNKYRAIAERRSHLSKANNYVSYAQVRTLRIRNG